jgi:hypothetical protein
MRYRLGMNIFDQQRQQPADGGIGRGLDMLASLPMYQAEAADQAQTADMKRQLMSSEQQQAAAHAALFGVQADAERAQLQRGTLPELIKTAALQNGVPTYQLPEATDYFQTGQLAGKYQIPSDQQGPTLPAPQYADPAVADKIYRTLGLTGQALTVGDKSVENIAKASGAYQQQDDIRRLQADPSSAGTTGQAYAAVAGKPLIGNIGDTGDGFNHFTGQGVTLDPGIRVLYGNNVSAQTSERNAAAGAHTASAAASYASAAERKAQTDKVRQEIAATQMLTPGGVAGAPGAPGATTGEALLGSLNPQVSAQVKALAEGRMQFPAGQALKSPYWQQMLSLVSRYDPTFDAVNYSARSKTRADFTSGKAAQNLNAFNTVLGHLDSLVQAGTALNNTSYPLLNKVENTYLDATGDPRPKAFDANKKAVVDELTRAWRGSGGSEGDIKSWSEAISNTSSPEQLAGVSHQIAELLRSKIDAMGEQYNQGMGTTKDGIQLLTPHAQQVLTRLGGGSHAAPAGTPAADPLGLRR